MKILFLGLLGYLLWIVEGLLFFALLTAGMYGLALIVTELTRE